MKRLVFLFALLTGLFLGSPCSFGQSWSVWRTTPVFDGERVMPLSSFASQIVKEICGTSTPYLTIDDDVLDELNRLAEDHIASKAAAEAAQARKNFDHSDSSRESIFNYEQTDVLAGLTNQEKSGIQDESAAATDSKLVARNVDPERIERIRRRVQVLIPQGGRYFDPTELLLSWMGEPEVWDYIPIFAASEWDYREGVLGASYRSKRRFVLRRISVVQLKNSKQFQSRLHEIAQKQMEQGPRYEPTRFEQITERINRAYTVYQQLTFSPMRSRPTRMLDILQQTLDVSSGHNSSFDGIQHTWRYLLTLGDAPLKNDLDDEEADSRRKHPTTEHWEAILHKIMMISAAFDRTDAQGEPRFPNLDAVQNQFELVLQMIDQNLKESEALMEGVYPGLSVGQTASQSGSSKNDVADSSVSASEGVLQAKKILPQLFSVANKENTDVIRNLVLQYHYSVKKFRREIESAYLALFDGGRSLRVLPIISRQTIADSNERGEAFVQPWGSLQSVLYGSDAMIRRFYDARFDAAQGTSLVAIPRENKAGGLRDEPDEEDRPETKEQNAEPVAKSPAKPADPTEESEEESKAKSEIERLFFARKPPQLDSSVRLPVPSDSIGWIRVNFARLVAAYENIGSGINWSEGGRLFNEAVNGWSESLRDAANKIDSERAGLIDPENVAQQESYHKTKYPSYGTTYSEYRYFSFAPFFWMWVLAACSVVLVALAMLVGVFRRGMIDARAAELGLQNAGSDYTNSAEEFIFGLGLASLGLSVFVTFVGGLMRAMITGWAPVTNMYETVVLMAFCAALLGIWYGLHPLFHPIVSLAWRITSFPSFGPFLKKREQQVSDGQYAMRQAASDFGIPGSQVPGAHNLVDSDDDPDAMDRAIRERREGFWRSALTVPRLILMLLTFWGVVNICYGEYAHEHGVFAAMFQLLAMHDFIDWLVVVVSIAFFVWFVPYLLLTAIASCILLFVPSRLAADAGIVARHVVEEVTPEARRRSELSGVFSGETNMGVVGTEIDDSGSVWLTNVRNQILDRKMYILVGAFVALLAGLAAYYNSSQFNPNIRPLMAVLRSNFWLTAHVIAIIISYAAASVAWGMSAVALGDAIFGRYRRAVAENGKHYVLPPSLCDAFAGNIHRMIRFSVLMLAIGTILGARWADYSWGRFWSWDPKEVWALITLLFFVIVLHGRIGRLYGQFGVVVGGLLGSIAVIMTWYGINFVMNAGMHAYGGSVAEGATIFLYSFIVLNLVWGLAAVGRYCTEMHSTADEY